MIKWIIIAAILACLLFAILFLRPVLYLDDVGFNTNLKITKGCYTEIKGTILNKGLIEAKDVIVACQLSGAGENPNASKNIGRVPARGKIDFTLGADHHCPAPENVNCSLSCKNCYFN